jgi:hypothetical protein
VPPEETGQLTPATAPLRTGPFSQAGADLLQFPVVGAVGSLTFSGETIWEVRRIHDLPRQRFITNPGTEDKWEGQRKYGLTTSEFKNMPCGLL